MPNDLEYNFRIGLAVAVLVTVSAVGCGSKGEKSCGATCSSEDDCRSPYVCIEDGMTSQSYCMPETCRSCSSGLRCYYTSPDNDGECSFDNCR